MSNMKMTDFRSGMRVVLRNGDKYRVVKDTPFGDVFVPIKIVTDKRKTRCIRLSNYAVFKLTHASKTELDIMSVLCPKTIGDIVSGKHFVEIYKRPEPCTKKVQKLTMDQVRERIGFDFVLVESKEG